MKRFILSLTIGIVTLLLCSTCKKEHVAPVNQLVKDLFCFKTGSEWTYYDSVSQTTQKMIVTNFEVRKFAPEPKGGQGKIYDYAESIHLNFTVENMELSLFNNCKTWLMADRHQNNTLNGMYISTPAMYNTLHCTEFSFHCDGSNNFIPSAAYLSNYTVNGVDYSDVYVFNESTVNYYVSKHVGFIRCVDYGYFDLVLIDKNVQQ